MTATKKHKNPVLDTISSTETLWISEHGTTPFLNPDGASSHDSPFLPFHFLCEILLGENNIFFIQPRVKLFSSGEI